VRSSLERTAWVLPHSTDEDGRTWFNVHPHSKGKFYVGLDGVEQKKEQAICYEIGGEEDAGREFSLQVSDEMLEALFK
jgi:hypothetical protein